MPKQEIFQEPIADQNKQTPEELRAYIKQLQLQVEAKKVTGDDPSEKEEILAEAIRDLILLESDEDREVTPGEIEVVNKELEFENRVAACEDFRSLYHVILETKVQIVGSHGLYSPEKILEIINKVRDGERSVNYVTSSFGLRSQVEKILALEKIRK